MRKFWYVILLSLLWLVPISADPIINGDGANGSATNSCGSADPVCWARITNEYDGSVANDDGVRITLIELNEDGGVKSVQGQIDYSNIDHVGDLYFYNGNVNTNKYFYKYGSYSTPLTLKTNYKHNVPSRPMPWVVRARDGANNMEEVKKWFSKEGSIEAISSELGMSCTDAKEAEKCELVSTYENGQSKYKLLIEPIAYVQYKIEGKYYTIAMTPTEMAMYDSQDSSKPFLTAAPTMLYNTFAKAMFLTENDLGFSAYTPSGGSQSINTIKQYLGMAIISFNDAISEPEEPEDDGDTTITVVGDGKYRVDTDVYTSVYVSASVDRNKNNPIQVTFNGSNANCSEEVVVPEGDKQLVWCKWHTPSSVGSDTITVRADGITKSIPVTFSSLDNLDPPDTTANDKKPKGWKVPSLPALNDSDSKSWSVWYTKDYTNWEVITTTTVTTHYYTHCPEPTEENPNPTCERRSYTTTDTDKEEIEKTSFYQFAGYTEETKTYTQGNSTITVRHQKGINGTPFKNYYSVSMSTNTKLEHDPDNPTAKGNTMKSGYGVCLDVSNTITGNGEHTVAQTGVASFPEFDYDTYWRKLDGTASMQFKKNKYDLNSGRTHFTPIWYPDNKKYAVRVRVIDAWTPAGMLSTSTSDYKNIKGDLYDDWAVVNGH